MMAKKDAKAGYCIYVDTVFEGPLPVERDGQGYPFVYTTLLEAQHVIAEDTVERIRQFFIGEREFDDAMTVEEYVVEVDVLPDGSVCKKPAKKPGSQKPGSQKPGSKNQKTGVRAQFSLILGAIGI